LPKKKRLALFPVNCS